MAILIDPGTRTVTEVPDPPHIDPRTAMSTPLGIVITNPLSVFDHRIQPFYFEPLGIQLGRMLIVQPTAPLPAIERMVTWVRTLAVISGATIIVPRTHPNH